MCRLKIEDNIFVTCRLINKDEEHYYFNYNEIFECLYNIYLENNVNNSYILKNFTLETQLEICSKDIFPPEYESIINNLLVYLENKGDQYIKIKKDNSDIYPAKYASWYSGDK